MNKLPWMKYDPDLVSMDVDGMSLAEEGAYSRAVRHIWRNGPLPLAKLERLCGPSIEAVILCMEERDGGWSFPWLEDARGTAKAWQSQRSEAGKASASKRNDRSTTVQREPNDRSTVVLSPSLSSTQRGKERDERFEAWYAAYPVKKSRGYAESAWAKLTTTERDQCLPAITAQVKACNFRGTDGKDYVPHPATWLNARRWEDEVSTSPPPTPPAHEMTLREAIAECERIRAANGIAPGAYLPTHLIPAHVSKAMHRG